MDKKPDVILSSFDFLESIVPNFSQQISNILGSLDDLTANKDFALVISDYEKKTHEQFLNENIEFVKISRNDLDYKISGTVTLKELVNGLPIPVFMKSLDGKFIGCNPSFTRLFGFEELDIIGKSSFDISPEDEAHEYVLRDKEIIRHQGIQVYEGVLTNKYGVKHDVIFRKSIIKDSYDNLLAIVGVIIDITKRKNIEKTLWEYRNNLQNMVLEKTDSLVKTNQLLQTEVEKRKEQELLLKTIFDSTYDAIILFDFTGKIINVNSKMIEMFKVKLPYALNLDFLKDLSANDNDYEAFNDYLNNAKNGLEQFFEWNSKYPYDDITFTTEVFLRKISLKTNNMILANIRDISRRKHTESLLLQEHSKVKIALKHEMLISTIATILNTTDDFFIVLDNVLEIIVNTLAIKDMQFISFDKETNSKIKKKKWLNICIENNTEKHLITTINTKILQSISVFWLDLTEVLEINRKSLTDRGINSLAVIPLKIQHKVNGMLVFENSKANAWTSKHYTLFNTIGNMFANAWERCTQTIARLEAEKKNVEAVHLIENSARLASIGVMAAGITHEINQPLNAIKVTSDSVLFQEKRNPGLYSENLINKIKNISVAAGRIDEIIRHMRSFWVTSSSRDDEKFELHDTVIYALKILKNQMNFHGINIELLFLPEKIYLFGTKVHFEQIIINLCVNSIHALDKVKQKDKKIIIKSEILEKHYKVIIQDNGPGLPDNISDKIFDPFYSTKKPGEGMGLGLAIVKLFMDSFKGEIKALNNQNNEGACFELYFQKK